MLEKVMLSTDQRKKSKINKNGSLIKCKDMPAQIGLSDKGNHCHVTAALSDNNTYYLLTALPLINYSSD